MKEGLHASRGLLLADGDVKGVGEFLQGACAGNVHATPQTHFGHVRHDHLVQVDDPPARPGDARLRG